jgi:hypothetical protein
MRRKSTACDLRHVDDNVVPRHFALSEYDPSTLVLLRQSMITEAFKCNFSQNHLLGAQS